MKFPGTYYAYAGILALFGETAYGIHVGLLLLNAATSLMLFALGRRLLGAWPASAATVAFALLSLDRWIMGVFAHATHFVLLPMLAGILLLWRTPDSVRRIGVLGAGVLMGIAVLMKQHAVFFLPFGVALIWWHAWRHAPRDLKEAVIRTLLLALGSALPVAGVLGLLASQGVFDRFWFWTFQYAAEYVSQTTLSEGWDWFARGVATVTRATLWFWIVGIAGLIGVWLFRWPTGLRVLLTGFAAASLLALSPGLFFRPHYFILLLPLISLGAGVSVATLARMTPGKLGGLIAGAVFAVVVMGYIVQEQTYLFSMSSRTLSRTRYGPNPFIEAVDIARYIRDHTTEADRIAVLGSEPEVYFYADRKSATGYIYTYALMEPQPYASRMQDEMMDEIEAARPTYIVMFDIRSSWIVRSTSDKRILFWIDRYAQACYDIVGVGDIVSESTTIMHWGADAARYEHQSEHRIITLRQRNDSPCTAPRSDQVASPSISP